MLANIFPEVTTNYIISQSLGLCALIVVCVGYFLKTRQQFFITQIMGNCLIAFSYFFLGTFFACIGVGIACVRSLIFYVYEIKNKLVPLWLIGIICILTVINCAVFWSGLLDLLPLISLLIFTFAFRIKDDFTMKLFLLIACFMFAVFNFCAYHYTGLILKTIEIIVIIIALVKIYSNRKKCNSKNIKKE